MKRFVAEQWDAAEEVVAQAREIIRKQLLYLVYGSNPPCCSDAEELAAYRLILSIGKEHIGDVFFNICSMGIAAKGASQKTNG